MEQEHDRNCFQAVPSSFKRKRGWLLGFTVNYLSLSHHFRFYYARGFHPHFWTSENTYVENIRFILFVPRNKALQSFYSYKKICFSSDFKGLFNWRVACPIFKQEWMRYSRFLCENRLLALEVSPSKWLARKFLVYNFTLCDTLPLLSSLYMTNIQYLSTKLIFILYYFRVRLG